MPVGYGLASYTLHLYLVGTAWSRVRYCASTGSIAYFLPSSETNACSRPHSLVDTTGWIQFVFYSLTLFCHVWFPGLEGYLMMHGSFFMNAALLLTFWSVPWGFQWTLSGGSYFGTWNAVYGPIFWWWVYLFWNRNRMGLSFWFATEELFQRLPKDDDSHPEKLTIHSRLQSILKSDQLHTTLIWIHRLWMAITPFIVARIYLYFKPGVSIHALVDVPDPNIFVMIIVCFMSSLSLLIWYSYLTFQIRHVEWKVPYRQAVVVLSFENETSLALVY